MKLFYGLPSSLWYNLSYSIRRKLPYYVVILSLTMLVPPISGFRYRRRSRSLELSCSRGEVIFVRADVARLWHNEWRMQWWVSEILKCFQQQSLPGGWPSDALNFAKKIGVCSSEYAYKNIEGVCRMKSCARVLEGSSLLRVVEESLDGDEERLKRIVNAKGPVVVVMHINEHILGYGGGVYIDDLCPKDDVNHAVVRQRAVIRCSIKTDVSDATGYLWLWRRWFIWTVLDRPQFLGSMRLFHNILNSNLYSTSRANFGANKDILKLREDETHAELRPPSQCMLKCKPTWRDIKVWAY